MKKLAVIVLAVFSVGFIVGGAYALVQGNQAYNDVKTRILAQHITTSPDAAIPNVLVNSAVTALAEADVIGVHAAEAVKGMVGQDLSYAQIPYQDEKGNPLPEGDPRVAARSLLEDAAGLRSALYGTVAAFKLAELVMMLGVGFAALGLLFGFGAVYVHKT